MNFQQQFEELHQSYQGMVLQLCLGFTKGDMDSAKDLSQEVFVNTWNALQSFKGKSSYKTWLYRITVNTCLMQLRKQKRMPTDSFDKSSITPAADSKPDHDYNELYAAIGKLAEVDRLLIMLVLDELSYDEIGEVMGISQVNLRVKIHRVKEKLKNIMQNGRV